MSVDAHLVATSGGMVHGTAANDLIVFKGIPYAQPPVGALCWRAPQPVAPWRGVLEASNFRPDGMQLPSSGIFPPSGVSEDCLHVNVWRPASADKPLPVMVWIAGGGLIRGGASLYPLDTFARQGIVTVSLSYRLGRFGFFAHPALAREDPAAPTGNYGYMDQIAALKWIQRNIAVFGGDPHNVTIDGESAGGGSVLVLLTSPLARGLFHRAIMQSPGIPTGRAGCGPLSTLVAARSTAVAWARSLGIEGDGAAALAALRALPAETVLEGSDPDKVVLGIFGGPRVPGVSNSIVDGLLIAEPPETALRAGHLAMVPVIVGANDMDLAVSAAQSKDELFAVVGPLEPQARALYDPQGDARLQDLIQTALADRNMLEPSRNIAELIAMAGQPAYFYRFSYVPEALRGTVTGAAHGDEIAYAFDGVSLVLRAKASQTDIAMGHTMSGYWDAFVKTGNPNGGGRPHWPSYDPASREVLNFANTGVTYDADPMKARIDLWRSVWEQSR